jgi:hypothetical protein
MIKHFYKFLSRKYQTIHLDYQVKPQPRFGQGLKQHALLNQIISENTECYQRHLQGFLEMADRFNDIKEFSTGASASPVWNNGYFPGLDIVSLYGMLVKYKPKNYIEIGSGNSTMVVRKAISENNLSTQVTSIDPYPRADIDAISDVVIRQPLENLDDLSFIVNSLGENDILFIDNSHRSFANSDVTVCFMELLPYLQKGVIVHVHDIYLPHDYPQFMCDRFYNEQYFLAAFIMANPQRYGVLLPNYFISQDPVLKELLTPLWQGLPVKNIERHGGSFWIQIG